MASRHVEALAWLSPGRVSSQCLGLGATILAAVVSLIRIDNLTTQIAFVNIDSIVFGVLQSIPCCRRE